MTSTAPMTKTAADLVRDARAQLDNITPAQAHEELTAGSAVAVDVREPVEWEHHIEGALQVPRGLLEFAADPTSPRHIHELDPQNRVIVYCRSGVRSALAGATLKTLGYENVANLDGGLTWRETGLPTGEHHSDL